MLLTQAQRAALRANSTQRILNDEITVEEFNPRPVVKLFHPLGGSTWLLTELDQDGDRLYGLCDLGMGEPELGYVSLRELESVVVRGLGIERDLHFTAARSLAGYASIARAERRIVA